MLYTGSLQSCEVGEKRERTVGEESGRMVQRKASWLRLKPGLRAWASGELRSFDAQIAYLLREVVRTRKGGWGPLE